MKSQTYCQPTEQLACGDRTQTAPVELTHLERMVWGSDWPHPTEKTDTKPDDTILFDLLADWVPDEATRSRILVDNPAALYRFD